MTIGRSGKMLLDGYAGWVAVAVIVIAVAGGLWGRRSKK